MEVLSGFVLFFIILEPQPPRADPLLHFGADRGEAVRVAAPFHIFLGDAHQGHHVAKLVPFGGLWQ